MIRFISHSLINSTKQQLLLHSNPVRSIHLASIIQTYVETIGKPIIMPVDTSQILKELRVLMKEEGVNVYLQDSGDAHSSEYVDKSAARRQYISGFTGSAGTAVVEENEAKLYTDGRYFTQAEGQLGNDWKLEKVGNPDVKTWQEYLATLVDSKIGFDPTLITISDYNTILPTLHSTSSLVSIDRNLVDKIWKDRPKVTAEAVVLHDIMYSGQSANSKIEGIRNEIRSKGRWGVILSQLDEVAWTLNLRGNDIAFTPVFFAYLVIPVGHTPVLFINIDQLGDECYQYLTGLGILIEPYESVVGYLENVGKQLMEGETVIVPSRTSLALASAIGLQKIDVYRGPVVELKAIKNSVEIEGFRQAHLRDGIALCRYFSWLERRLESGEAITEFAAAEVLEAFRQQLPLFKGLSFATISSTGANGSIIHYQPSATESSIIDREKIYLCDSGAQFNDGTTDTTRTWHFGKPNEEEIRAYTRVLQGHIAIDTAIFPQGTTGYILDVLARKALWSDGLDYKHGTSHGVGNFLGVHEGPQGIGTRIAYNEVKLRAGHTLSNEPGCYIEGKFGIRIENVVVVVPAKPLFNFGASGWLKFENFTMCPISTKLVDKTLLSPAEIKWLNDYNMEVRTKLIGRVEATGDKEALSWLVRETEPLVIYRI